MTKALLSLSTDDFLAGVEAVASKSDSATYPQQNLPADDWALLVGSGILLPALPKEYGGRDSHVEMCRISELASEQNLALGVHVTVNTALGLRPVAMWAGEEAKQEMLSLFVGSDPMMAGFAATGAGLWFGYVRNDHHVRGSRRRLPDPRPQALAGSQLLHTGGWSVRRTKIMVAASTAISSSSAARGSAPYSAMSHWASRWSTTESIRST